MNKVLSFICALILALSLSQLKQSNGAVNAETRDAAVKAELSLYPKDGEIVHFFTHALIAYPELAFKEGNSMRRHYDNDCLTVSEFKAILLSLYQSGYALVDIMRTYTAIDGNAERCAFPFPKDKKPLVLSFDDINYYIKKMHRGMNDRLCADEKGRLCTFTERAETQINYDNEVVTVLENFIEAHPDFSFDGARGLLCLTGFDGVLGYRTQIGSAVRSSEAAAAERVVAALKERGWRFACHSYGHYHMKAVSNEKFFADTDKWLSEVRCFVGNTDIYVYPYGEWEISGDDGRLSEKHAHLRKSGFNLFCGVGAKEYYAQIKSGGLLMDRKPLDGYSLRHFSALYSRFFDCEQVFDTRRPLPYKI